MTLTGAGVLDPNLVISGALSPRGAPAEVLRSIPVFSPRAFLDLLAGA